MQLGYPEEVYINKITVYDTVCGAFSVSQVSVWNPQDQVYVPVFTQAPSCPIFDTQGHATLIAGTLEAEIEVKPSFHNK